MVSVGVGGCCSSRASESLKSESSGVGDVGRKESR